MDNKAKEERNAYTKEYMAEYRRENKERINAQYREWRKRNTDKAKEYKRRSMLKLADKYEQEGVHMPILKDERIKAANSEYNRRYRERNRERINKKDRDYYHNKRMRSPEKNRYADNIIRDKEVIKKRNEEYWKPL